jgi:putative transposase
MRDRAGRENVSGLVCPELAGTTVPLREILRARNRRRRELRIVLRDRQNTVDTLLELKRGESAEKPKAPTENNEEDATVRPATPRLKRYRNE